MSTSSELRTTRGERAGVDEVETADGEVDGPRSWLRVALVALVGAGATPGRRVAGPRWTRQGRATRRRRHLGHRSPNRSTVSSLPLPPTAPTAADGSVIAGGCTNDTGCLSPADTGIQEGPSYLWDGKHVVLPVVFDGAPAGSPYTGAQVIAIKTTPGATFSNGDAWKCLTCGIPEANQVGRSAAVDHPQPFHDGKRILVGNNILDCGDHVVTDDACTPETTHIYPIRWNVTADGSGAGGSMRELRLSPDDTTLGWSHLTIKASGVEQFAFVGHLRFDPAPTTGTPLVPRYELDDVTRLFSTDPADATFRVDPKRPGEVIFNPLSPNMGELRGFTSDGKEVIGINNPAESNHVDVFATNLRTGKMRRLTPPSTPTRSSRRPTTSGSSTSTSTCRVDRCGSPAWTACRRSTTW